MFCQNCGMENIDNSKFCVRCGKQIALISNSTIAPAMNDEYNRTALKLHLSDLRAMEYAKNKLGQKICDLDYRINSLGYSGRQTYVPESMDFGGIFGLLVFAVIAAIAGNLLSVVENWMFETSVLKVIGYIVAAIFAVIAITHLILTVVDNNKKKEEIELINASDDIRVENELREKQMLEWVRSEAYKEFQQAEQLLERIYSVNIVPKQFRDLYAVHYLYDFVTTSNESLTTALMNYNLEQIKQKLDTIIEQQREIILNQAIQIAQNEKLIKQNQQQINQLARIEQNTEKAATYSKIAASNAEACAWIGLAQYIKD